MTSANEVLPAWLSEFDTERADRVFAWLIENLAAPCFFDSDALRQDLVERADVHRRILSNNFAMCKAVEHFAAMVQFANGVGEQLNDPGMIINAASMLNILLQGYEHEGAPEHTLTALEQAHASTLTQFLILCSGQIEALCGFLKSFRDYFSKIAVGKTRILLLDLPVGNSLPVALLESLLSKSHAVEIVTISLSRNDAKLKGITREELLKAKIVEAEISRDEILLYVDEWNTGVNFNRMLSMVKKLTPANAFLFSGAMLTAGAAEHSRFKSFCEDHDAVMSSWGLAGSEFRKPFPPIPSALRGEGYFFWSEYDRMSGFRKMQIHGSLFSSFDDAIQLLKNDEQALAAALQTQLAEIARERPLPKDGVGAASIIRKMFYEAYDDYQKCRQELNACADEFAAGGETDDLEMALAEVIRRQEEVVGKRPAKLAFIIAHAYLRRFGSIDPADRYHFKEHAPTLLRLEGRAAKTHEITKAFVLNQCEMVKQTQGL